jgi:hypothetical protein
LWKFSWISDVSWLFDACGVDVGVLLFIDEVNFFDLVHFNLANFVLSFLS